MLSQNLRLKHFLVVKNKPLLLFREESIDNFEKKYNKLSKLGKQIYYRFGSMDLERVLGISW